MSDLEPGRPRLFGLTADQWLDLASGYDAEVGPCCGNISNLRENLQTVAGCQDEGLAWLYASGVLESYEVAVESHDTLADKEKFPLLHHVIDALTELRDEGIKRNAKA